jgi:phosphoglycerate dehydrogenase-like enzyme
LPKDLAGQHVVLVGWGPIAQRLAQFLKMLSLEIRVVRQLPQAQSSAMPHAPRMITFQDLPEVLPSTNWLILTCPLTETTRGLVNAKTLSLLPRGAGLVNVARGEVVIEKDLIQALQQGILGSAFLDVFEHEPLPKTSPLWDLPNVILTPHSAGFSAGNEARVSQMFLKNLAEWAKTVRPPLS